MFFFDIHRPLTMSESLTKLAQRIDFCGKEEDTGSNAGASSSNENGDTKEEDSATAAEGAADSTFKTAPSWPWESVRNKIRYNI